MSIRMLKKILLFTLFLPLILIPIYAQESENIIPSWIKGVAAFWVEGNITDEKFIEVLEFLIENEVIQIEGYGKIDILEEKSTNMELTVTTDKESYTVDDKMNISGTLPNNELDTIVILLISPSDNLVIIKDVQSTGNGEFSIGVNLVEELMKVIIQN